MTDLEVAWFAGLFDGEGNICWPKKKLGHFRLSMSNTSHELLLRVQEVSGTGKIYDRSALRSSNKHSPVWTWVCQGQNARLLLAQFHQWLIVKREAAEIALNLRAATEPPMTQRTRQTLAAKLQHEAA